MKLIQCFFVCYLLFFFIYKLNGASGKDTQIPAILRLIPDRKVPRVRNPFYDQLLLLDFYFYSNIYINKLAISVRVSQRDQAGFEAHLEQAGVAWQGFYQPCLPHVNGGTAVTSSSSLPRGLSHVLSLCREVLPVLCSDCSMKSAARKKPCLFCSPCQSAEVLCLLLLSSASHCFQVLCFFLPLVLQCLLILQNSHCST